MAQQKSKGALAKTPSVAASKPGSNLSRVSPGIYRNAQGQLTNAKGRRIDQRGRPVRVGPAPTQGANVSPEQQFRNMSPEQQQAEMYSDAGAFYNRMMGNAMGFDPNNPTAGYQQGFGEQMNQARQTVMDQFERTMAPQFQQEQAQFQQQMAEQGIDPNSPAYQARYKAMMDAQNTQRLNAQSEAFKLGGQYQQQGYEQAIGAQTLPFQQWQAASAPWQLQYQAQQDAIQKERDRQAALKQAGISAGAGVRSAQISADASRYAADLNALNSGYGGSQQPDWRNELIRGAVAGATSQALK